ncbi:MAG TPA: hypothetical protein ENJ07_02990 [Gammaproteobacteria bacterium]|nr:hypothetical protein [Gammaproteobacteria bacterium]
MSKKAVYIVASQQRHEVNERVNRIFTLKDHFSKMVLVCPTKGQAGKECLNISPYTNPTGILRLLGLNKLKKFIDQQIFFPSTSILYVAAAKKKLCNQIQRDLAQGLEVCLITCAPNHALCLLGLYLKRQFPAIKWIMDWQDLWSLDKNYASRTPRWQQKRLLRTESEVFTRADINITTNQYAKKVLETQFNVPPNKVIAITHPFHNEDLLKDCDTKIKITKATPKTITIGFLGNLFKAPKVPGEKVLEAIEHCKISGVNIELHICGGLPESITDNPEIYQQKYGLQFHGSFDHTTSLSIIAQCDFMLLVLEDLPVSKTIVHAKLPHYLLTGKPILAIAPSQSAIADIIQETGSGYLIKAEEHWGEQLQNILQQLNNTPPPERDEAAIQNYSWDHIKVQWLDAIDREYS